MLAGKHVESMNLLSGKVRIMALGEFAEHLALVGIKPPTFFFFFEHTHRS